jgi:preprotein translocase subunit SecG
VGIAYVALIVLYVIICFFLILVVLLQQGKGADIAGAFGGGGTQTAFGARGATTVLHKLTTGAFVGFILIALALTVMQAKPRSSVVRNAPAPAAAPQKAPAPAAAPAAPAPQAPISQAPAPSQPPAK